MKTAMPRSDSPERDSPASDNPPSDAPAFSHALPVATLKRAASRTVDLVPDADARAALCDALGLTALRKVSLRGRLSPEGARDWRLEAMLGATVIQPCSVTLQPVTTRIDEPVRRVWRAEMPEATGDEVEIPEDVSEEPLGREIDLGAVLAEALALAMPAWPRAEGAELGEAVFGPPGTAPMRDEDARPFASLAGLRDALAGGEGDDSQ